MSDATPPQAGWYADPENPAGERWWNGSGWSDHKRDATAPVDPAPAPPAPPAAPTPPAVDSGFSYGVPDPAGPRPDPYAPPPAFGTQPYYGAPVAPAPYGSGVPSSATNGLAVAGLVLSIAGFFLGVAAIAGVILSAFGLAQARKRAAAGQAGTGRGLAIAGLVVGIVACFVGLLFFVLSIASVLMTPTYS